MKKYGFILALLVVFSLILSACGSGNSEPTEDQNTETQADTTADKNDDSTATSEDTSLLNQVKDNDQLLIGTEGTYPPFTFHNDAGELTGFDVEIAREVAKRLGVEPVFKETKWDSMFAGLNSKRFDMIANEVGIRPDRQEKYDFSDPYIQSAAVLVVSKNNDSVTSFEDMKNLKAAQSLTSNYADIAKEYGAEIVSVEGFNEAMQLIATKRVDVTVNDSLSVLDYLNQKPDAPIKIVARRDQASASGLMFRKGNEDLVDAVNKALQAMKDDGTYLEISKKWFGEDVSK